MFGHVNRNVHDLEVALSEGCHLCTIIFELFPDPEHYASSLSIDLDHAASAPWGFFKLDAVVASEHEVTPKEIRKRFFIIPEGKSGLLALN